MCPACLASLALIAGGATSAGGLTALALKRIRARSANPGARPANTHRQVNPEIEPPEGEHHATAEDRFAH
jgi:hypothetical protein